MPKHLLALQGCLEEVQRQIKEAEVFDLTMYLMVQDLYDRLADYTAKLSPEELGEAVGGDPEITLVLKVV